MSTIPPFLPLPLPQASQYLLGDWLPMNIEPSSGPPSTSVILAGLPLSPQQSPRALPPFPLFPYYPRFLVFLLGARRLWSRVHQKSVRLGWMDTAAQGTAPQPEVHRMGDLNTVPLKSLYGRYPVKTSRGQERCTCEVSVLDRAETKPDIPWSGSYYMQRGLVGPGYCVSQAVESKSFADQEVAPSHPLPSDRASSVTPQKENKEA
ncbi:hypothetical protein C8J57DRAFT_1474844 [Mycena rebaudengoi]|nr:hypothetical protein C8J57DRAFT_1474844 [Mycena rebaudengoi]